MSKSSKTFKDKDLPALQKAQREAALRGRQDWVEWMRATFSFAMAMKMARHLGFPKPCLLFYVQMRQAGLLLLQTEPQSNTLKWGMMSDVDPIT